MISTVVLTESRYGIRATWLSTHVTNGIDAIGEDALDALRGLVTALERAEERRAGLPD